jgi:microcompartment protein CcmL/EutN
MVEFAGIAVGIRASDAMVKAAPVDLIQSHPIDPGKYLAAVTGDVASVNAAVEAAEQDAGPDKVVDRFVIANLHDQVLPALKGESKPPPIDAVGIIETRAASSIVEAADAACKAAPVTLVTLHLALRIGGKGYTTFVGDVADVEASVTAGSAAAGQDLLEHVVIPNPYPELYAHLTAKDTAWHGGRQG